MRSVQDSVETLAKSVSHEQRPAVYNEARGNFYFFGPTTVQVIPAQQKPDTNALELALWDSAKTATTVAEVQAYLNRFPSGFFAEMARARIVALGSINSERVAAENIQRLAEEARTKEQQRIALEAQQKEQIRLAQEARQKEQERQLADQNAKEQLRIAEETRIKEQQRIALDARQKEQVRLAQEARVKEQESLLAEQKAKEQIRLAEESRIKEQQRLALEAQLQERARLAQEAKQKEQERLLAEQKSKDQIRLAEEARVKEQQRLALEAQQQQQIRSAQEARQKEQERLAAVNTQKLTDERAIEEAKTSAQDAAERIALTAVAIDRANKIAEEKLEIEKNQSPKTEEQNSNGAAEWVQLQKDLFLKRAKDKDLPNKIGWIYKDCEACPEMLVIAGNTFLMGSESGWFAAKKPPENEQPQHSVSLKTFSIGRLEVTQKEWLEIMGTSPSYFKGDSRPVEQVSWEEVQIFLEKLSLKTGNSYRLPTEAEWEYAALGNQQTEFPSGSDPSLINKFAWYSENSSDETHVVGSLIANKFGLFDMYGNVDEMTSDCYNPNFKNAPTDGSSWNQGTCDLKVVRGGSWHGVWRFLRSKSRFYIHTKIKSNLTGFRVVRDFTR